MLSSLGVIYEIFILMKFLCLFLFYFRTYPPDPNACHILLQNCSLYSCFYLRFLISFPANSAMPQSSGHVGAFCNPFRNRSNCNYSDATTRSV